MTRRQLTPHQERIWFIDQFETGNVYASHPTYHNIPLLIAGHHDIEPRTISAALSRLTSRHAVLRTRLHVEGDAVEQSCAPRPLTIPVPATRLGEEVNLDAAIEVALAEAKKPFDLLTDPLLRGHLFFFGSDRFLLLATFHHLVVDKPSLRMMALEISALIADPAGADSFEASPLLMAVNAPEREQVQLRYWRDRLAGGLAALELPSARPRPAVHTYTEARQIVAWDPAFCAALRAGAARLGVEPEIVTLAAFKVLLHRYARQDEIVIGRSEACRRDPTARRAVGPIANLVVLRSDLAGNPAFRELARQIAAISAAAREHQEMPFDRLVLALNPAKDMSRTALFDVLFEHDEQPLPELNLGRSGRAKMIDPNLGFGKYDLNLSLVAGADGGIEGTLVYNADFHDRWFIAQMMHHLERILREAVARPETPIDDLRLLSPEEERRLAFDWNATAAAAPRDQTIHELFSVQARKTPNRVALTLGRQKLTYDELEARSNQLAGHLADLGVGRETLVGVCLERSFELIVSLLAILKAGGAYLPLDPTHPGERIAFTLRDAEVQHLVTTRSLARRLELQVGHIVRLDEDEAAIARYPRLAPPPRSGARDLAYCIYTSGSTGRPKGVLIEHRQVVRLLINDRLPFAFSASDVWTMFHSPCFDFSVWEMYGALLYGGRLVIVPRLVAKDSARFVRLVARERVTVLNQTPTSFYHFAQEALTPDAPALTLHTVIFGGEALSPIHLAEWRYAYPGVRLVNMYGITETTVHVTHADVSDDTIARNLADIGRPIPTTTTYLMDERRQLVPLGVPGEICVGGEGVGRGYLRRAALTQQRFISNPYRPSERLYCSGDLAVALSDGRIVYLGRIDDQVQIRGFRVELGEIKTVLLKHPAIREVEVIARPAVDEALQLIAYVVGDAALEAGDLRRYLVQYLPEHMVPAVFVPLPAIPLTANGKVDRRALPEPVPAAGAAANEFVAPRTEVESALVAIWCDVLRQDAIGIRDNFFVRGGHSLLASKMKSRVKDAFGVELPLRRIFEAPTIEELAPLIAERMEPRPGDVPPDPCPLRDAQPMCTP